MNHVDVLAKSTEYCFQGSAFNIRSFLLCMSTLLGGWGEGGVWAVSSEPFSNQTWYCLEPCTTVLLVKLGYAHGHRIYQKKEIIKETVPFMAFGYEKLWISTKNEIAILQQQNPSMEAQKKKKDVYGWRLQALSTQRVHWQMTEVASKLFLQKILHDAGPGNIPSFDATTLVQAL